MNGDIWQLELAENHLYYYFPPGSSILSLPYVAVANAVGVSAAKPDGTYNPEGEIRIETGLAAILMAALAAVFYFTSRLILPLTWSVLIAVAGVLGTQVWSTASRGLWSHTWETFLTAIVVYMLLAFETGKQRINSIALASVLSWMYFVRPSAGVVVFAVSIYVASCCREAFVKYLIAGSLWLAGFVVYSWIHYGKELPSYYRASRLRFDLFPVAFAGNLISPSRGLLVYVPVTLFVVYLLGRYRQVLIARRLVWLSLSIIVLHVVLTSAFANLWGDWWGGASYGPRYMTDVVPWLVLLAGIAVKAWRERQGGIRTLVETACGLLLVAMSVFINARGAVSLETWKWTQPATDKQLRAQLWDWHHPQFLAGLQSHAPPTEFPLLQTEARIDFRTPEADKYLWYGWSGAESNFRWSDGREATFVFALDDVNDLALQVKLGPFLAGASLPQQNLVIKLNKEPVKTVRLSESEIRVYAIALPRNLLSKQNVLTFELAEAASPASLGISNDYRQLGIRVEWLELRPESRMRDVPGDGEALRNR